LSRHHAERFHQGGGAWWVESSSSSSGGAPSPSTSANDTYPGAARQNAEAERASNDGVCGGVGEGLDADSDAEDESDGTAGTDNADGTGTVTARKARAAVVGGGTGWDASTPSNLERNARSWGSKGVWLRDGTGLGSDWDVTGPGRIGVGWRNGGAMDDRLWLCLWPSDSDRCSTPLSTVDGTALWTEPDARRR